MATAKQTRANKQNAAKGGQTRAKRAATSESIGNGGGMLPAGLRSKAKRAWNKAGEMMLEEMFGPSPQANRGRSRASTNTET